MNRSKRSIYRLDEVSKKFYTYCLFYSLDRLNTSYNEDYVFYVGKAKNTSVLAYRREREHIREAYLESHLDYHKSRKIRLLEESGYFIMSKVLEEFDHEDDSYNSESKWQKYFIERGNDLTNMIECGHKFCGSGENHPSFDKSLRENSEEIIKLYTVELWPIQRICRHYKLSQKTVKKILFMESNNKQRTKNIRSEVWKYQREIIDDYASGIPAYKLCKKYNCAINTITNILRSNGVKVRGRCPPEKSSQAWKFKEDIIKDYMSGYNKKDLSKKYKCDIVCTINKILKEACLI